MDKINLEKLYKLQAELDSEIAINHNVCYACTHEKRLLALTVELGELANETRCFKYWSLKPASPKEVVMDEYADGIHFLLSLGIPLNASKMEYVLTPNADELTVQFHNMYRLVTELRENYDLAHYEKTMQYYLNMVLSLGFTGKDITESYLSKLEVNHKRQENKY